MENGPDGGQTDPPADEYQVFSFPLFKGEAIPVGTSDPYGVSHLQVVKGRGNSSHFQYAELEIIIYQRRRRNRDHRFPFSKHREHGTLSAFERETILFLKLSPEGFNGPGATDLFFDMNDLGQFWNIGITLHNLSPCRELL